MEREEIYRITNSGKVIPNGELIRCKDCKHRSEKLYDHYGNKYDKRYVCQIHGMAKRPDWFCADGERRTD